MRITIRKATPSDANFIALVMSEAINEGIMKRAEERLTDIDKEMLSLLENTAKREDTLYSWTHTFIAETADKKVVGGIIAYDGSKYRKARSLTFELLRNILTFDPDTMDEEAHPGEFYLDSLAVLPDFRGKGIGRALIQHVCFMAKEIGMPTLLACHPENSSARRLYEDLGFQSSHTIHIFGENYLKMIKD